MKSLFLVAVMILVTWIGFFKKSPKDIQGFVFADSLVNAQIIEHYKVIDSVNVVMDSFEVTMSRDQKEASFVCIKAHSMDNFQIYNLLNLQIKEQEAKANISTQ